MGKKHTATDCVDTVQSCLETYFEKPSAERVFRDKGQYKPGWPCRYLSSAKPSFVEGLHPPEFQLKIKHDLDMKTGWKQNPDTVFDVVRAAAVE